MTAFILLAKAHGSGFTTNDHVGKAFSWDDLDKLFSEFPPGLASDVLHIKALMAGSM